MIEDPNLDDAPPENPPPGSDSDPAPRFPKSPQPNPDERPETFANVKVTPLDEDNHLKDGIEVNET